MILFNDWTIRICGDVIARQYDNLTRRIEVLGDLPDGWSWSLLVQVGEDMDILWLEPMEGGVGITLDRNQLAFGDRHYDLQLRGLQGELVRHTNIVTTFIPHSISGDGQWPEVPSEFTQLEQRVHEDAVRAKEAADSVDGVLDTAQEALDTALAAKESAEKSLEQVLEAQEQAEKVLESATEVKNSVEQSQKDAAASAVSAGASATAADKSRKDAETAAGKSGRYYTPKVSQPSDVTMQVSFDRSSTEMPSLPNTSITLPRGAQGQPGVSGVHVGSGTPPASANIWINPNGRPTGTEEWAFDMDDGTTEEKTVVVLGADSANGQLAILRFKQENGTWAEIPAIVGSTGPQGQPGQRGEPGPAGEPGLQGEPGPQGVSGVYVGSGAMPDGYNVQIDPDGKIFDLEELTAEIIAGLPIYNGEVVDV